MSLSNRPVRSRSPAPPGRGSRIRRDPHATHWGTFDELRYGDQVVRRSGHAEVPRSSPIGDEMLDGYRLRLRVRRPTARRGRLQRGASAEHTERRGSESFALFRLCDTPVHASWLEQSELLGSTVDCHPPEVRLRGIPCGDVARVFNDGGSCLAGTSIRSDMKPGGLMRIAGGWWDPSYLGQLTTLDRQGAPHSLTHDIGTTSLSQGPSALTRLVPVGKFLGHVPRARVLDLPEILEIDSDDCASGTTGQRRRRFRISDFTIQLDRP